MAEQQDSAAPRPARDWALHEKPTFTVAEIIRHWCELPDDFNLKTDPKDGLPVDHHEFPLIKVRTDLVMGAIRRKTLDAESSGPAYCFGFESIPWNSVVVPAGRMRYWFVSSPRENPSFLFWRENVEGPPQPTPQEEAADPGDFEPVGVAPGRKTEHPNAGGADRCADADAH
jgi:hypothetical protein